MGNKIHITPRGMKCDKCKRVYRKENYESHVSRCMQLPSAREIANVIESGKLVREIAKENNTDYHWIMAILKTGGLPADYVNSLFSRQCPECGDVINQAPIRHIKVCESYPMDEINDRMHNDEIMSTSQVYEEYGIWIQRVTKILIHKYGWTDEEIKARGKAAKVAKHKMYHEERSNGGGRYDYLFKPNNTGPRCEKCEILVKEKGQLCDYCTLELNGIKSYKDFEHA